MFLYTFHYYQSGSSAMGWLPMQIIHFWLKNPVWCTSQSWATSGNLKEKKLKVQTLFRYSYMWNTVLPHAVLSYLIYFLLSGSQEKLCSMELVSEPLLFFMILADVSFHMNMYVSLSLNYEFLISNVSSYAIVSLSQLMICVLHKMHTVIKSKY